jgi:DNA polymerase-4
LRPHAAGDRSVGFAEVRDFHVEVARRADPALALVPLLVGGDPSKRGKVIAASADLRSRGLVPGMGMVEALDRAAEARWVPTDMRRAREQSGLLRAAVRREVGAVEIEGLAGFYLCAPADREEALAVARRLEARVAEQMGLPLRVGVAPARFAASLVAEDAGRSGARVVVAEDFEQYLLAQPIDRLPGAGPKTAARLAELGATDIPSLRRLGLDRLEVLLGNHGRSLWLLACGQDPKPLRVRRHPTTLSREESFAGDERDPGELGAVLVRLSERLEQALQRDGLRAGRIALRLTYADERTVTRSHSFDAPVSAVRELAVAARALLDRIDLGPDSVRRAGLVLRGLEISGAEDRQLDLF